MNDSSSCCDMQPLNLLRLNFAQLIMSTGRIRNPKFVYIGGKGASGQMRKICLSFLFFFFLALACHGPSRNSSKDRVDFALNFTVLEYDFVSLLKQSLVSLQYFLTITGLVVATENLVGNVKNIVQTDGFHLSSACSNLNVKDKSITDRFP